MRDLSNTRLFHPRNVAVPTPLPAGGVGHLLAMDGQELKKLAKKIVLFEYLRDNKDRYVFNPEGKPVPKIEQDDEALIREAMKKCRKITNVSIPVYVNGEQQFEDAHKGQRQPRVVSVYVDAATKVCETHDAPFEGRCADCALIVVGDYRATAAETFRDILSETIEAEVDVKVDATREEIERAKEVGDPVPEPRTVKRKVEQLLAEWQIERCVEYGRAKKAAELKN